MGFGCFLMVSLVGFCTFFDIFCRWLFDLLYFKVLFLLGCFFCWLILGFVFCWICFLRGNLSYKFCVLHCLILFAGVFLVCFCIFWVWQHHAKSIGLLVLVGRNIFGLDQEK